MYDVLNGKTKSCGCIRKDLVSKKNTTHGLSDHPLYNIWCHIKARCYDEKQQNYKWYGAKGIKMSEEWKNNFKRFYDDMISTWIDGLSIERIDSSKDYSVENCTWIPMDKQQSNRSNNVNIIFNNEKYKLADLARKLNINAETVKDRIAKGKLIATIIK